MQHTQQSGSTIVVFSHLRWNFVYQRPQQILSRLTRNHRVLFIEEPLTTHRGWKITRSLPGLAVCQPGLLGSDSVPFSDAQIVALKPMLHQLLKDENVEDPIAWFYTPMATPLLEAFDPQVVVYDCMDELSAFLNPPVELIDREKMLLKRADVVFTGGPSIYKHKRRHHRNVRCFPSSVDVNHFASARGNLSEPPDQISIPRPRLGFFGVIDERMDLDLLDALAIARPTWQIVMVGPVVKIDPATLPKHANIHYLGQHAYEDLPRYLSGWDVCLLPFAINKATEFISPTKTLEYMAAEKPMVSTPITDVAEPYGGIVRIARTHAEFIHACEQALNDSAAEKTQRIAGMRRVLAKTSWDQTTSAMWGAIEAITDGTTQRIEHPKSPSSESRSPVVVIGAGPTGLSATYHLGDRVLLLEANEQVGGWCRSLVDRGFTFDWAGHIMFSKDQYVHDMYAMLLGENVHWQDREAFIYSKGVYTRYPFQGCLYGLPADVITECIMGAIEARYGSAKERGELEDAVSSAASSFTRQLNGNGTKHGKSNGHPATRSGNALQRSGAAGTNGSCNGERLTDCCADGIAEAEASNLSVHSANGHSSNGVANEEPRNFEEFIYKVWGKGIAKHFAIPYNQKLWAVPLDEMETSWLGGRVPMPDIEEMIRYSLTPASKPMGPNARFGYPLRGGFQSLMNGFLPHLRDRLRLNSKVVAVSPTRQQITLSTGEQLSYEFLISTMPLPSLIKAMGDEAPVKVRRAARLLRYVSVRCVNLGIGRPNVSEKHWVYYPEDTVFHRIFFQGNASPHCNPPGGFGLTCEITYSPSKPLPCDGDELIERCIDDCKKTGLITENDPIWAANQVDLPFAYVVYDHDRAKHVAVIREWLEDQNIFAAGRYGQWEYFNSDHAFITGKRAAEEVMLRMNDSQEVSRLAIGADVS